MCIRDRARNVLANAYSFMRSMDEREYLSKLAMDDMIEQSIRQLGDGTITNLRGTAQPAHEPPFGNTSRRARLEALKTSFNGQLDRMKELPEVAETEDYPGITDLAGLST